MCTRYFQSDHVVSRPLGDGAVLVPVDPDGPLRLDVIYSLNRVAAFMWECLAEGATGDELVRTVCEQFDVSEDQASADVGETVNQMAELDLVVTRDAGAS